MRHELLLFLQEVMPVAKIYLQHYDDDYQAMRTVAYSSGTEYGKLDLLTPLTQAARDNTANFPDHLDAFLITDPLSFPVSKEMTAFHDIPTSSVIAMALRTGKKILGYLILTSEGKGVETCIHSHDYSRGHRIGYELSLARQCP